MRRSVTAAALLALLAWPPGASTADEIAKNAKAGETCGTRAGIACDDGLWCDLEPGHCVGADLAGVCVVVSGICTRDFRPVCGCDGKTYPNDCSRRAARQQKDHDGECRETRP